MSVRLRNSENFLRFLEMLFAGHETGFSSREVFGFPNTYWRHTSDHPLLHAAMVLARASAECWMLGFAREQEMLKEESLRLYQEWADQQVAPGRVSKHGD